MKLLITGASGFIGSRLMVAAAEKYGSGNVLALGSRPLQGAESIIYDKTDFRIPAPDVRRLDEIEVIVHAGAFTPTSASQTDDIQGSCSNIRFTEELLAHPFPSLRAIVYLSTLDVYAPAEVTTEETPALPASLYGHSKLFCENLVRVSARQRAALCHILRIGHVYGPGEERYQKFIPNSMRAVIGGTPVELWGTGADLRSYIFVDDVVKAILASAEIPEDIGIVNVVSGTACSIRDLLDRIIEISGERVEIVRRPTSGKPRNHVFDNRKCKTLLLPEETDLHTGLRTEYRTPQEPVMNIIFDLDGTLIDSRMRLYRLFQQLVPASRLSFEDYWELKKNNLSHQHILADRFCFAPAAIGAFLTEWMDLIESPELLAFDQVFPEVGEALAGLSGHARLHLCTARQSRDASLRQLERLGLLRHFHQILVTGQVTEKVGLIREHIPALSSDDWIIGDTGKDILTGKALGIRTCAVLSGFMSGEALRRYAPDLVLDFATGFTPARLSVKPVDQFSNHEISIRTPESR